MAPMPTPKKLSFPQEFGCSLNSAYSQYCVSALIGYARLASTA